LINEHHIQFYTVKTTKQNKITAGLPVFIEYCHLKVFSSSLEWDNLGELDTFSVEVSQ